MTTKLVLIPILFLLIASYSVGQDAKNEKETKPEKARTERIVIPSEGVTDFTVTGRATLFRIAVTTPSGGTIADPVITGKAKLLRTAEIIEIGLGGTPLIGAFRKEFVFRGTGAGKVKVEIERTVPASPKPIIEVFNVTIK